MVRLELKEKSSQKKNDQKKRKTYDMIYCNFNENFLSWWQCNWCHGEAVLIKQAAQIIGESHMEIGIYSLKFKSSVNCLISSNDKKI